MSLFDRFVRFRISNPGSPAGQRLKTLLQIVILWSLALCLFPGFLFEIEEDLGWASARFAAPVTYWAGLVLLLVGTLLGLWSAWVMTGQGEGTPLPFDTARRLVVSGPYAHVRNPMAMGGIAQMTGVALLLGSPLVLAYAASGFALLEFAIRPWEEEDLERRFGEAYRRFRKNVPRWKIRCKAYEPELDE